MKKIVYITGNWSKIMSAKHILEPLGIKVDHIKMETTEIQADTVEEIAIHSAKEASDKLKCDVLKNDSLSLGSLSTSANTFSASKTYTCTLRVWLQDSGSSQNNLMNKSFSGLVKVGTAIKK